MKHDKRFMIERVAEIIPSTVLLYTLLLLTSTGNGRDEKMKPLVPESGADDLLRRWSWSHWLQHTCTVTITLLFFMAIHYDAFHNLYLRTMHKKSLWDSIVHCPVYIPMHDSALHFRCVHGTVDHDGQSVWGDGISIGTDSPTQSPTPPYARTKRRVHNSNQQIVSIKLDDQSPICGLW